jgi:hypothetical protein
VPVYDGYGTTEAGGIATDNVIGAEVDVKLVDVPELGYLTTDQVAHYQCPVVCSFLRAFSSRISLTDSQMHSLRAARYV